VRFETVVGDESHLPDGVFRFTDLGLALGIEQFVGDDGAAGGPALGAAKLGGLSDHRFGRVYVSQLAAEAQAIQVAKELSGGDETWHGGWIWVENSRGYEIAKMPIGIGRTLTKYEAAARRTGRLTDCDDD
jgi:hypothetical protein